MIATLPERDLSQRRTFDMKPEVGTFILFSSHQGGRILSSASHPPIALRDIDFQDVNIRSRMRVDLRLNSTEGASRRRELTIIFKGCRPLRPRRVRTMRA
jgi:hypothetical protein